MYLLHMDDLFYGSTVVIHVSLTFNIENDTMKAV